MGLFFNPNNHKDEWASIVMSGSTAGVTENMLKAATDLYISQHGRILLESIQLFLTSKNKATRKSRYKLACEHYGALVKVKKFADKKQKKQIDQLIDDFVKADDLYRHPNRAKAQALQAEKKRKKDEFWEAYGMLEMIEIFSDDWD